MDKQSEGEATTIRDERMAVLESELRARKSKVSELETKLKEKEDQLQNVKEPEKSAAMHYRKKRRTVRKGQLMQKDVLRRDKFKMYSTI